MQPQHNDSTFVSSHDWSDFDDLEDDLYALSREVTNMIAPCMRSTAVHEINDGLRYVKGLILHEEWKIQEATSTLLGYMRYVINHYIRHLKHTDSVTPYLLKGCKKLVRRLHCFEKDVWSHFVALEEDSDANPHLTQFDGYIAKNTPFFETLPTAQHSSLNKIIHYNRLRLLENQISGRDAVRNVETHLDELQTDISTNH